MIKKVALGIFMTILAASFCLGQEEEILKLKEKIIEIQNKGTLGFRNFSFCSQVMGFGSFVPLERPEFAVDGEVLIYFEPVNVFTGRKEGLYEIWYTEDLELLNNSGELIKRWDNFLSFRYTSRLPVLDLLAKNTIGLEGQLEPGKYKFRVILNDKLGRKKAEKIADFMVR